MKTTPLAKLLVIPAIDNDTVAISAIRNGFPRRTADAIASAMGISLIELTKALPISATTLKRRCPEDQLDVRTSDRLYQIAKVFARAVDVFGREDLAAAWFKTPVLALGNCRPLDLLDTSAGIEMVATILGRIEHGVHS